jgi:hypothetical protein
VARHSPRNGWISRRMSGKRLKRADCSAILSGFRSLAAALCDRLLPAAATTGHRLSWVRVTRETR